MSSKPWPAVVVKVLAPVAEEPSSTLRAECSLSTQTNSASSSPSAIFLESDSTMWVWGVMG